MAKTQLSDDYRALALLPLRDVVVYPHMVLPLFVGRAKSIAALEQKNPNDEEPKADSLHKMGTVANVLQVLKLPDGTVKVLVEGIRRARALTVENAGDYFFAHVEEVEEVSRPDRDMEALRRTLLNEFDQFAKLNKKIPAEVRTTAV